MIPMNVAFPEADLASHVLRMCPHTWQDQFNLHEKGLNPMDMRSLLQCLEAIERVCTQERSNAQSTEKASTKNEKGNNHGPNLILPNGFIPRRLDRRLLSGFQPHDDENVDPTDD